jgi:hypothetical protein
MRPGHSGTWGTAGTIWTFKENLNIADLKIALKDGDGNSEWQLLRDLEGAGPVSDCIGWKGNTVRWSQ